jgi:phosphate transport system permease protein
MANSMGDLAAGAIGSTRQASTKRRKRNFTFEDRFFRAISFASAMAVLALLGGILVILSIQAWPAPRTFGFSFFTSSQWDVVGDKFGGLAPITGTLETSLIAMVLAVPVAFGIATYITQLAPDWFKKPVGIAIELLAAVPSIIFGMWGLFVFAPFFGNRVQPFILATLGKLPLVGALFHGAPIGIGAFSAGFVLALMSLPFITAVMRDVFEVVPTQLRESAFAMGSTTWEVVWKIILPYTKAGVASAVILGLGRALGETMAVTFVVGNSHNLSTSLFMPGTTISATIANDFAEASTQLHQSALIALGLLLFLITFTILCLSKLLLIFLEKRQAGETS